MIIAKKHISDYGLKLVGSTYFDSNPGNPKDAKYYIAAKHVDSKGFFNPYYLKTID